MRRMDAARSDEHSERRLFENQRYHEAECDAKEKEVLFHGLGREDSVDLGSVKMRKRPFEMIRGWKT